MENFEDYKIGFPVNLVKDFTETEEEFKPKNRRILALLDILITLLILALFAAMIYFAVRFIVLGINKPEEEVTEQIVEVHNFMTLGSKKQKELIIWDKSWNSQTFYIGNECDPDNLEKNKKFKLKLTKHHKESNKFILNSYVKIE